MSKIYSLSLSLAMMAAATVSASAEGIHLGYCDGKMPSSGTSYGALNQTISAAICLTPDQLAPYASCQITSLYIGVPEGLSKYPETFTAWLRTDKEDETNITEITVAPEGGWMTLQLEQPLNIADYAAGNLWVGYSYKQGTKKFNMLALGGQTGIENSAWVAKNGNWADVKSQGALSIEAIVEGEGLPQHDLALTSCVINPSIIRLGSSIKVNGTIKNNALVTAEKPVIKVSFEDKEYTEALNVDLGYRDTYKFVVSMPLDEADDVERDVEAKVEVLWSGDIVDDFTADNEASFKLSLKKDVFYQKMVVEEATGGWCQWCVRGIVGLREMRAKYPNTFIGMGVHNGDPYVVNAYDRWIGSQISGYPSCLINRDGKVYDPSFKELENYMSKMDVLSPVGLGLEANYADGKLEVTSTIIVAEDMDVNYQLAFVVLEDQLPITQSNAYAGGGNGPMGGFESLPASCQVDIDDVVRAIYPSPNGEANSVPTTLVKGEKYTYTNTYDMCSFVNKDNLAVVVMLIDTATKKIVNGEKIEYIEGLSTNSIQRIESDSEVAAPVFNLNGQRTDALQHGLNIVNGRVIFIAQ